MSENWHNNNDFYFIRDKKKREKSKPEPKPKPYVYEEDLSQQVVAFIKKDKGYAEAEIMLFYGDKYYDAIENDPDAKCDYFFRAKHNTGEKIVDSELLSMPFIEKCKVNIVEIPDITFNLNSAVPCLDKERQAC